MEKEAEKDNFDDKQGKDNSGDGDRWDEDLTKMKNKHDSRVKVVK